MRINPALPTSWQDLQVQVATILTECGLSTEIEKTIRTVRGTVEVDVYANDPAQIPASKCLCECKYWSTPVSKDVVHAFRTVVGDFGASSGLLISKAGFQSGAREAAEFSNIRLLNWDEFEALWQERWIAKCFRPRLHTAYGPLDKYTAPLIGTSVYQRAEALPEDRRQAFIKMRQDPTKTVPAELMLHFGLPWELPGSEVSLPLEKYKPQRIEAGGLSAISSSDSLREVMDYLCNWSTRVIAEFESALTNRTATQ